MYFLWIKSFILWTQINNQYQLCRGISRHLPGQPFSIVMSNVSDDIVPADGLGQFVARTCEELLHLEWGSCIWTRQSFLLISYSGCNNNAFICLWYKYRHKHEGYCYSGELLDSNSNIANGGISLIVNGDRRPWSHEIAEISCSTVNEYCHAKDNRYR